MARDRYDDGYGGGNPTPPQPRPVDVGDPDPMAGAGSTPAWLLAKRNLPANRAPRDRAATTQPTSNVVNTPLNNFTQQMPASNIQPAPQYSQSAADQLRRTQAWNAIQQGREQAGLTQEQIQAMQNDIANRMSSESSSAERMAREQAARQGLLGSGSADRRQQELAAMNQARASGQMSQIQAGAAQDELNRRLQYDQLAAGTASQFGQDEFGYAGLGEQALFNRMNLGEQARQANLGASTDMWRWQNEADLLDRYRTQERDEYRPILDDILGNIGSSGSGNPNVRGFGVR